MEWSCTLPAIFLPEQAGGVPFRPKKGAGGAGGSGVRLPRNLALPPEFALWSIKRAAFCADLVTAPAPCRSEGGLEGGDARPPIPMTMQFHPGDWLPETFLFFFTFTIDIEETLWYN